MSKFEKDLDKAFREKKEELLHNIKESTPVKTGRLKAGWNINGDKIENNVDYASYVNDRRHFIEVASLTTEGVRANGTIVRRR